MITTEDGFKSIIESGVELNDKIKHALFNAYFAFHRLPLGKDESTFLLAKVSKDDPRAVFEGNSPFFEFIKNMRDTKLDYNTLLVIEDLNKKNRITNQDLKLSNSWITDRNIYKEDFITETETTIPFSVINRYDFDNQLLANYLNANGEYRFKCTLKQVNVTEKTVTFFNGETFSYDYIIGADGAFSMMRQYVDKRFNKIFFCFESFIDNTTNDSIDLHFGNVPYGYGWRFPRGNKISIGLGSTNKKRCTLSSFKDFLIDNDINNMPDIKGAFIPYDYVKKPCKNNVFLIGDSAGLCDPITGEGIYYAILSGNLVAQSIGENINNSQKAHEDYLNKISNVHQIFNESKKFKKLVYNPIIQKFIFPKLKGHKRVFAYATDNVISYYKVKYTDFIKSYKKFRKEN